MLTRLPPRSGTLGSAILSGLLHAVAESKAARPPQTAAAAATVLVSSGALGVPPYSTPKRVPTHFIACVRRADGAQHVRAAAAAHGSAATARVTVLVGQNVRGAAAADVVLLACQPTAVRALLTAPGMARALAGKLLVSIVAGFTEQQLEALLDTSTPTWVPATFSPPSPPASAPLPSSPSLSSSSSSSSSLPPSPDAGSVDDTDAHSADNGEAAAGGGLLRRCRVVCAMPNTAAFLRESMTLVVNPSPAVAAELLHLTTWIFLAVGQVAFIAPQTMDICTALCGSAPAYYATFLDAFIDGAVAMGVRRAEAQVMAAHTMRGTASLVLAGEPPAVVRENVTPPGGSTIRGCLVMEEGRVRWTLARALQEAAVAAGQLGQKE
jgi:pyrroline-5-carboxylate reductase